MHSTIHILPKWGAFWFIQCLFWLVQLQISGFVSLYISVKFCLFWTIYDKRKPVDWMMNSSENVYVICLLNSREKGTENSLRLPFVRIMAVKQYLHFVVKDDYIITISSCTHIQCYLKSKISIDFC